MQMKPMVKLGIVALAMGAFFGADHSVQAGEVTWVRAQPLNFFRAKGLVPPGYFSKNESQTPATVAVSKSGQGLGGQQPGLEASKTRARQVHSAKGTR